jgi:hypothetical protein
MQIILLATLLLLTALLQPAFAYLDPGSGSMLVAGLAGLLTTLMFFLKGLYYKGRRILFGVLGKTAQDDQGRHQFVFYSEGRQYWSTFKPIIDELVGRRERCVYLTSDEEDPGLRHSSELVRVKCIGRGTTAYVYLTALEADICAMTTPGLDVLHIRRSKRVKHYAHLIHAPTDIGIYKRYSFDYFDSILISGDHQGKSLRKLEELRGTPRKLLFKTGCLYYDEMWRQLKEMDVTPADGDPLTVLVAPTWGLNGLLKKFGARVLIPMLEKQWRVIVRPHPQSYISERIMLDSLREELKQYPNLQWDSNKDGIRSMVQANAMVSDLSGIVFDFAFLFEKPVITLKFELDKLGSEAAELPWDPWELTVLDIVGRRIAESEMDVLPKIIEQELGTSERTQRIRRLRDESVANFACAAKYVADELLRIRDDMHNNQVDQQAGIRVSGCVLS